MTTGCRGPASPRLAALKGPGPGDSREPAGPAAGVLGHVEAQVMTHRRDALDDPLLLGQEGAKGEQHASYPECK